MTVTDLTKVAVSEQPHSPKKDSPDTDQTFSFIEPCLATHSSNYMDCTESNDDDDDDDDNDKDDTEQPPIPHPSDVAPPCTEMPSSKLTQSDPSQSKTAPPCWQKFFKVEPVLTDESELDNSQNSHNTQTLSTENTASQSPELFLDEDEDDSSSVHLTSSQSTHVSDAGTESLSQMDTVLSKWMKVRPLLVSRVTEGPMARWGQMWLTAVTSNPRRKKPWSRNQTHRYHQILSFHQHQGPKSHNRKTWRNCTGSWPQGRKWSWDRFFDFMFEY